MAKFSGKAARPNVKSPMRTTGKTTTTYEGGLGYERDAKTQLFLLAVSNMVRQGTFYESATDRDNRFKALAQQVTVEDPQWVRDFIPYLRNTMQMRSASVVLAAHYTAAGGEKPRAVIDSAITRADEPAEFLAYWAQEYGKNFPMPVKRGVADAAVRLYNERNALKYDGQSRAWRMGDVIELTHAKPEAPWQSDLFKYLLDTRHKREDIKFTPNLAVIEDYVTAHEIPVEQRCEHMRKNGIPRGMTWESLSGWLQGPMDAEAWEAVIPQMGYMALLRNLRNFEAAGISQETTGYIRSKLSDPDEVAKSRQFPIRFYSAWKATDSLEWGRELEKALDLSLRNVPELSGRTLVMIDCSGSMNDRMSDRSENQRWEVASVFGTAFAKAQNGRADVYLYSNNVVPFDLSRSVLKSVDAIRHTPGLWGGTYTWGAVSTAYNGHDRVLILTDEQAHDRGGLMQTYGKAIYTFNLAGYRAAHTMQGEKGSYVFGGLSDAGFVMLKAIDELKHGHWPWEA